MRNTRVMDVVKELMERKISVDVYDPLVNSSEAKTNYDIELIETPKSESYDGVLLAVAHDLFKELSEGTIRSYGKKDHVLYDLKHILPKESSDIRL